MIAHVPQSLIDDIHGDGYLLVGDAAGLVCPCDGSGYEAAVCSGYLAAEAARKALDTGDTSAETLFEYEKKCMESWVGSDIRFGAKAQDIVFKEMGISNFNRLIYDLAAAFTKHGSYMGKSHIETLVEFLNVSSLQNILTHVFPSITSLLDEQPKEKKTTNG